MKPARDNPDSATVDIPAQRSLPDFPGTPLVAIDGSGRIVDVNAALCDLLQRPRQDLVGHQASEFSHPDDLNLGGTSPSAGPGWADGKAEFEKRLIRADGTIVSIRGSGVWLTEQGRAVEHVVDLTELIDARDTAQNASSRLAALLAYSADVIFVVGQDGSFLDVNPAGERLFGGRTGTQCLDLVRERVMPEDLPRVVDTLATALVTPGQHEPITFRVRTDGGAWIHMEALGNNQLDNPAVAGLIINARDVTERENQRGQIEQNLQALLASLGRASEFRDPYTAGHQHQVANIASAIAKELGLDAHVIESVRLGGEVHDIGKIAIPAEILGYPGKLTPAMYELIKTHCQIGYDIVADIAFPWPIASIVLQHHERLDGSGYPNGLHEADILLESQIVAVADVADAITSHRPYRPALNLDAALGELQRGRGSKYNPAAVDVFANVICRR